MSSSDSSQVREYTRSSKFLFTGEHVEKLVGDTHTNTHMYTIVQTGGRKMRKERADEKIGERTE